MAKLKPFYEDVSGIYDDDHSPDLLELFLGTSMVYSCAYFQREEMTLEEAQIAKLDLSLDKCDLRPGHTLLDIGCGYGACAYRAAEKYRANVIGLTLSKVQANRCSQLIQSLPSRAGKFEVRVQGWEEFQEPVDRIVSIGAFEHFRRERYEPFFRRCRKLLPSDGRMMLHSIVQYNLKNLEKKGIELTHENVLFSKFIAKEIFPGGQLVDPETVVRVAEAEGFHLQQQQSLQLHYARTLETWAENLAARREEAIARKSQQDYERYMRYLTGCADHFRSGHIDVYQFTLSV